MTDRSNLDRAAGALVGMAAGDALGAGYEFGPPLDDGTPVHMAGGGGFNWAPGEWTDDTSMAIAIAQTLGAQRRDSLNPASDALDEIVETWAGWARTAKDVGIQTRAVLGRMVAPTAANARAAAQAVHTATGRSAGNGSLMRTGPVALGYLDDPDGLAIAARAVSDLTHFEADAGDACVLWSLAIRHAILTGEMNVRVGMPYLPKERRGRWIDIIDVAEQKQPRDFEHNGWVVQALQGAWSAIHHSNGFVDALERAVRGGRDTDTVAAIAGSLIGAATGVSSIPARWRRLLHGWPGMQVRDLVDLAIIAVRGADKTGWPLVDRFPRSGANTLVQHPHDPGVWMGSLAALRRLPPEVDTVVSLCRVGRQETDLATVEFWLVDQPGANAHLRFVLDDAADTIAALRAAGRTVFLHCFEGRSRTPAVAAVYSAQHLGIPAKQALDEVLAALPGNHLNTEFRELIASLPTQ
jgi:ADP-ribosyl-[dinitrogen reductase] hydrolase